MYKLSKEGVSSSEISQASKLNLCVICSVFSSDCDKQYVVTEILSFYDLFHHLSYFNISFRTFSDPAIAAGPRGEHPLI